MKKPEPEQWPPAFIFLRKIRVLVDTLRDYADGWLEPQPGDDRAQNKRVTEVKEYGLEITENHVLWQLFQQVFNAPDTLFNPTPADDETRLLWKALVNSSFGKAAVACKAARELANWLEEKHELNALFFFDVESFSVEHRGHYYQGLRPLSFLIFLLHTKKPGEALTTNDIIECVNDGKQNVLPKQVCQAVLPLKMNAAGKKKIQRAVDELPSQLRDYLRPETQSGRRFIPPPR